MPNLWNSEHVILRDRFGNVRDNPSLEPTLDRVDVQIRGSGSALSEQAITWNPVDESYNCTFSMHSSTEYAYFVDILIN
eukprot:COSAG04_NODE_13830_length_590_cov_1.755601_2_plen_78_part_01